VLAGIERAWSHLFGMVNLLQECDERLSISSPKFLDDDLNDVNHQRSTMTEFLVWLHSQIVEDNPEFDPVETFTTLFWWHSWYGPGMI
jgi:hypothetical protein